MKTVVHVNQHVIRANRKKGLNDPAITAKTYKANEYGRQAVILCPACGGEAARVIQRMHRPLSCGARVWIETKGEVRMEGG